MIHVAAPTWAYFHHPWGEWYVWSFLPALGFTILEVSDLCGSSYLSLFSPSLRWVICLVISTCAWFYYPWGKWSVWQLLPELIFTILEVSDMFGHFYLRLVVLSLKSVICVAAPTWVYFLHPWGEWYVWPFLPALGFTILEVSDLCGSSYLSLFSPSLRWVICLVISTCAWFYYPWGKWSMWQLLPELIFTILEVSDMFGHFYLCLVLLSLR